MRDIKKNTGSIVFRNTSYFQITLATRGLQFMYRCFTQFLQDCSISDEYLDEKYVKIFDVLKR
jgi:hypothetical protein